MDCTRSGGVCRIGSIDSASGKSAFASWGGGDSWSALQEGGPFTRWGEGTAPAEDVACLSAVLDTARPSCVCTPAVCVMMAVPLQQ